MPLEKFATDTALSVTNVAKNFVKEVWSKMDAAAEKPRPSEYLSAKGVSAIQGVQKQVRPDQ